MNAGKGIQTGLLVCGYKNVSEFCRDKNINRDRITYFKRGGFNAYVTIKTVQTIADGFGVPLSTFIEWCQTETENCCYGCTKKN